MKAFLTSAMVPTVLLFGACEPSGPVPASDQARGIMRSAYHDFTVDTVVDELVHPFAMAFTPNGDLLVTERPGRLRIVRDGVLLPEPVAGLPDVMFLGNGGTSMDGREQAGMRAKASTNNRYLRLG